MACSDSDDEFAAFFPVSTRKKEGNYSVICPAFLMTALRSGFSPRAAFGISIRLLAYLVDNNVYLRAMRH